MCMCFFCATAYANITTDDNAQCITHVSYHLIEDPAIVNKCDIKKHMIAKWQILLLAVSFCGLLAFSSCKTQCTLSLDTCGFVNSRMLSNYNYHCTPNYCNIGTNSVGFKVFTFSTLNTYKWNNMSGAYKISINQSIIRLNKPVHSNWTICVFSIPKNNTKVV